MAESVYNLHGRNVVALDPNEVLYPGDVIWLRFEWLSSLLYVKAAQAKVIEDKLNGRKDFNVESIDYTSDPKFCDLEIRITGKTAEDILKEDPNDYEIPGPYDPSDPGLYYAGLAVGTAVAITAAAIAAIVVSVTFAITAKSFYKVVAKPIAQGVFWAIGLLAGAVIVKLILD